LRARIHCGLAASERFLISSSPMRPRVVFVALRSDLASHFQWPMPTHD
jgi:hypothetical protein